VLDLSENQIESIHVNTFIGLKKLFEISLWGNLINTNNLKLNLENKNVVDNY